MQEALEKMTLVELRQKAKDMGIKSVSSLKKGELLELLSNIEEKKEPIFDKKEEKNIEKDEFLEEKIEKIEEISSENELKTEEKVEKQPERAEAGGVLEVLPDGFGFLRSNHFLSGDDDVYINQVQIHRFNLKTGDYVWGVVRPPREGEKYNAIIYVKTVNGQTPDKAIRRPSFEKLTPIYPTERLTLESDDSKDIASRMIDIFAPIGKGQRGMIVAQPKVGKTTLLKTLANAITKNHKDVNLIVLLIDERPEEVTDISRSIEGERVEIVYSTFDETPEHHKKVAEIVLERAKRLVEQRQDVVVLLDSITRLSRAYNLITAPSGRTLSGGLDPAALHMPKKFFGAARNIENGGSLTILATALIETGSKMDDVVFEEFKGTGNMELVLDRKLAERRIFPAIDINKSGTRKDDLLLNKDEIDTAYKVRRLTSNLSVVEGTENVLSMMKNCENNIEFMQTVKKRILTEDK